MSLSERLLAEIRAHAARDYPREACGLVVVTKGRRRYVPCRNLAERVEHFVLDAADWAAAEDAGEIVAVVHSHPNLPPSPSQADLASCEKTGLPWVIISWPTGAVHTFAPSGFRAPLIGREFVVGVHDCYALVRDHYREALGIDLPDLPRPPGEWWLKGIDFIRASLDAAGFWIAADAPRPHDMLIMQTNSPVWNHTGVLLDGGHLLHHFAGRLSSRDVYGGWWRKCTVAVARHKELAA